MITSTKNPKIQWVRGLQAKAQARREARAFVVEGVRLVEEALAAGWEAQLVLCAEDLNERGRALVEAFAAGGAPVEAAAAHVLQSASDTETPQGLLAVLSARELSLPEALDFVLIPDGVRDPGNLGTMLRTAAAAGVQVVLLPPGSSDPFSPKVLRSGMGAQFRLPILSLDWEAIRARLQDSGLGLYLAAAGSGEAFYRADFRRPLALVIGGEAEGAGGAARAIADAWVHIPMPGGHESLNAAVAAGILMFEVVRQRRS
ncbi:MAG TPA: RNA methyltransferase [Anaerolineales bacterium]|nr:RNA methyltransferase [Anaerolineales bacterium]